MGTRANIVAKISDGRYGRIYTHWDGYPEHHGPILLDHYQEQAKIDALIALGDLSVLGPEIGVKHPFDGPSAFIGRSAKRNPKYTAFKKKYNSMCLAYGRDRAETGTEADFVETISEACEKAIECGAEFVYIWNGQAWGIAAPEDPDSILPLREFMQNGSELALKQTVKAFGGSFVLGTKVATSSTR